LGHKTSPVIALSERLNGVWRALSVAVSASALVVVGVVGAGTGAAAASNGNSVVVGAGQTLSSIAARYGTTVTALAALNGLTDPNHIVAGSVLHLPGAAPVATEPSGSSVVVGAGQTLSSIAARYGTTVTALTSLNGLANPNHIVIGSVLRLPGGSSQAPAAAVAPSSSTVLIQPGQTLTSIAAHYGTTVAALEAVNGVVNPNHIVAGMRLRLPQSSSSALTSYVTPAAGNLPVALLAHPDRLALRPLFAHWAAVSGVPPALLEAMCWWESGWQVSESSVTGAIGVCQLEPSTATQIRTQLGLPSLNSSVASDNIEMSAAYLHHLLGLTGGDAATALAGYYQGLASVRSAGWFPSTEQYVKGILAYVPYFS
jgi:LysM repeat protein